MDRIAVISNWKKREEVCRLIDRIKLFMDNRGVEIFLPADDIRKYGQQLNCLPLHDFAGMVDLVIVIGGDGTILGAARCLQGTNLPIMGVNMGQMGFLAEVEPAALEKALEMVLEGKYKINHRMMLSARITRKGKTVMEETALNDVVLSKVLFSRIVYVDTFINDKFFELYPGDGVIISTPTGSTGYSLSAGGPIVNSALDVIIITPISPHLLHHRSVVVASNDRVTLQVKRGWGESALSVDGHTGIKLREGDIVHISRSPLTTPLVQLQGSDFYTLLHQKLAKVINRKPEEI